MGKTINWNSLQVRSTGLRVLKMIGKQDSERFIFEKVRLNLLCGCVMARRSWSGALDALRRNAMHFGLSIAL
jgi:hypothetical protein